MSKDSSLYDASINTGRKKIHNIKLSIAARYYYSSSCGGTAWFTLYFNTTEERKFSQELVDNVSFEKNLKKTPIIFRFMLLITSFMPS